MRKNIDISVDGKDIKLIVKNPTSDELSEAGSVYAAKIASSIRQKGTKKLLLRTEVESFLRDHEIWTDNDEKKVQELHKEVDSLLNKLRKGGVPLKEGREICIQIGDKRKEIVNIFRKRQIIDDTTIESAAELERIDYIIYVSTVLEDGSQYWPSFEDMKNDKGSLAYREASKAVYEGLLNVDPDFEKKLPENKWMQKYKLLDDDLNYTDRKTGQKVDRYGNTVELEKEIKQQIDNLQGDIVEEQPFLDDDTKEPIVLNDEKEDSKEELTTVEANA